MATYQLWLLALGFCIRCSALAFVYVIHSVGCTFDWPPNAIRLSLGLVISFISPSPDGCGPNGDGPISKAPALDPAASFLDWVILWTFIAAFVTIVFTLGSTLLLTTCT